MKFHTPTPKFSSQEEDILPRSTRRVKDQEGGILKEPISYKESLLTPVGGANVVKGLTDGVQDEQMIRTLFNHVVRRLVGRV